MPTETLYAEAPPNYYELSVRDGTVAQQPLQQPAQQPLQQPAQQPLQQPAQQPLQQPAQQPPQQPTQQPPPTGQVYYPAQQPQVVPSTVYQMPYQIPRMYQQVNVVIFEVEVVR